MRLPRLSLLLLPLVFGLPLLAGGCVAPLAVTAASYGADGVSLAGTGKTTTDHMTSMVSKRDCALWRFVRGQDICRDREGGHDPYDVNYNEPFRSPSEGGIVEYGPPLRAAPDAPPVSWEASAYKPTAEPAPAPTTPAAPPTAVADAVQPAAAPAAVPPPPPKSKKAKPGRSAKRPSQGRAAPAR
jgi:hypothetical protein